MLKSYEAIYENGQFKWLTEPPDITNARVIVTVLAEVSPEAAASSTAQQATHALAQLGGSEPDLQLIARRRFPPDSIAGKGSTLGDIISPITDEEDWECLRMP